MISGILTGVVILLIVGLLALSVFRGWWFLFFGGCLILYGIGTMFSVSIHESFEYTRKFLNAPSNYFYFFEHIEKLLLALAASTILYFIPWKFIKKSTLLIFLGSLGLMILLFFIGQDFEKGANLWIKIAGNTIQPGEFFKVGFVFFLASRLARKKKVFDELSYYIGFMIILGCSALLYFILPDYGSLLIIGPVALILFWFYGGKWYWIILTLVLGFGVVMAASVKSDYVKERLEYFVDPSSDPSSRGIGRQTTQALVSVGGGGLIGKGYGKGLQKFGYIPEAQSDFIFAAFSEEVGFIGNSILLTLYFLLVRQAIKGLRLVREDFERGIIVGMVSLIIIQMFVNIGVNIKLLPLTGVTLPFISHGGSAILVNMLQLVLVHKIIHRK